MGGKEIADRVELRLEAISATYDCQENTKSIQFWCVVRVSSKRTLVSGWGTQPKMQQVADDLRDISNLPSVIKLCPEAGISRSTDRAVSGLAVVNAHLCQSPAYKAKANATNEAHFGDPFTPIANVALPNQSSTTLRGPKGSSDIGTPNISGSNELTEMEGVRHQTKVIDTYMSLMKSSGVQVELEEDHCGVIPDGQGIQSGECVSPISISLNDHQTVMASDTGITQVPAMVTMED